MLDFEKATKLLPYEFTKDNNIIAFQDDDLIEVLHCEEINIQLYTEITSCLLYTSPSPRDRG